MSKLTALLRRTTRTEPAPMGFTVAAGRAKNSAMLVTLSLDDLSLERAKAAAAAGVDSILLTKGDLQDDADAIRALTAVVSVPCGLRVNGRGASPAAAHGLGLDYLRIEDDSSPAALLLDEETGYVLAVDEQAPDTFLRILETMPFDALYAGSVGPSFSIRRQIELRRLSGFSRKPLFVQVEDGMRPSDLEALRDSGVAAVLLEADDKLDERISALRRAIEQVPPRQRRRTDRQDAVPVLPSVSRGSEDESDEE